MHHNRFIKHNHQIYNIILLLKLCHCIWVFDEINYEITTKYLANCDYLYEHVSYYGSSLFLSKETRALFFSKVHFSSKRKHGNYVYLAKKENAHFSILNIFFDIKLTQKWPINNVDVIVGVPAELSFISSKPCPSAKDPS